MKRSMKMEDDDAEIEEDDDEILLSSACPPEGRVPQSRKGGRAPVRKVRWRGPVSTEAPADEAPGVAASRSSRLT